MLINLFKTKEAYVAKIRISLVFSSIYHINTHFRIKTHCYLDTLILAMIKRSVKLKI